MPVEGATEQFRIGFLTAIELPQRGYVGGLLVTNHYGRPLEFQCTTPIQPNKTQRILYGPTLVPFILGELIGKTLVEKVGVKPDVILTEDPNLLGLREHVVIPVACVSEISLPPADASYSSAATDEHPVENDAAMRFDNVQASNQIGIGRQLLRFHHAHRADRDKVAKKSHLIPQGADLLEPFERVREALKETTGPGATR